MQAVTRSILILFSLIAATDIGYSNGKYLSFNRDEDGELQRRALRESGNLSTESRHDEYYGSSSDADQTLPVESARIYYDYVNGDAFGKVMHRVAELESGKRKQLLDREDRLAAFREAEEKVTKAEKYFKKAGQNDPDLTSLSLSDITESENTKRNQSKAQKIMNKGLSLLYASARQIYDSGNDGPRSLNLLGAILAEEEAVKDSQIDPYILSELDELKKRYTNTVIFHAQNGQSQFQILRDGEQQSFDNRLVTQFEDGTCWLMSDEEYARLRYGSHSLNSWDPVSIKESEERVRSKLRLAKKTISAAIANDMDQELLTKAKEYFVDAASDAQENHGKYAPFIKQFGKTLLSRKIEREIKKETLQTIWDNFVAKIKRDL